MFADLFEYGNEVVSEEKIKTECKLTPRQWKLYEFLKETTLKGTRFTQQEILERYENWLVDNGITDNKYYYGYYKEKRTERHFSAYTSARNYRKDYKALQLDPTIQKVLVVNKIATSQEEAYHKLQNEKIATLTKLKGIYIQLAKLEKHDQLRLKLNKERDYIEAILTGVEE